MPGLTFEERFWSKVRKDEGRCWEWQSSVQTQGYGRIMRSGRSLLAHRVAWEIANGAIPSGLMVCHTCDNRRCVNITHLFLGTMAENAADMWAKGRGSRKGNPRTHCKRGHEFTPENSYVRAKWSGRQCRSCRREYERQRPSRYLPREQG